MRVLFDTNILYSAYVRNSYQFVSMMKWVMINHEAVITEYIASEAMRNTSLKAPNSVSAVAAFLLSPNLEYIASLPRDPDAYPQIRDPKDQPILNAAIDNDVDIIITGDKHFHALVLDRPRIMYAADFIAEFMDDQS